ncbi:hypothetical protein [Clostridium polynesiense]|uniref:hypothetical protein n=1 Tax=Clostridium polynesiense TaxID=1325933 RepID=UPI00059013D6|nr:hypothetical protein [Clostridium polynesiense]
MKFITFFHMIRDAVIFAEKLKVRSISCRIKLNNIIEIEDLVYDFLLIIEEDKYFKAVFTEEIPEDFKKEYIFSLYSEKNTENLISDISSILDFKSGRENIAVIPAEPEEYYNLIGGYIKDNTLYNYNEELSCRYLIGELKNTFTNNVIHFSLNDLCRGSEDILLKIKKSPEEIQVFDGNSNNDIRIIAEAIKNSSIPYYIISGSSFLTCLYYLYNKSFIEKENSEGLDKMLILSSSKSLNYIDKLNDFIKSSKAEFYNLNIYSLIINPEEEQRRAYNYLVYNNKTKFIGVTTAASKEDIVN